MNSFLHHFHSAPLPDLLEADPETVYAPGTIQPHGMLLTLHPTDWHILQVSDNVEQYLGIPVAKLLGQPLQRLFPRQQLQPLIATDRTGSRASQTVELQTRPTPHQQSQRWKGTLHAVAAALLLELEPQPSDAVMPSGIFVEQLQTAIAKLRGATGFVDLAQTIAQTVRSLTGFDRVMVYQFASDYSGVVIAEAQAEHQDSYLGLHYPAIDVPASARGLFYRNWVRHIPDLAAAPVALVPVLHPLTQAPVDLSACGLRGVHPCHVEYLQNMGVGASLTISLINDQRLWGLIACHHDSPKLVDYETRKTCEFLGQFASMELLNQQERELQSYRTQIKTIQDDLQHTFLTQPDFIERVLLRNSPQLLDLVHAQGAAFLLEDRLTLVGQTPPESAVRSLLEWLVATHPERVFASDALSQIYPPGESFQAIASGLLAISIRLSQTMQKSYHLLWFRPEQAQVVDWAGNWGEAIAEDEQGQLTLSPRQSFELWKQTVWGRSQPWQAVELEAAAEMRNTLMLAVLEFSQVALEQAAERAAIANRAKSQFLAKMSHELRTPLNVILGFAQVMNRSPNIPSEFQEHLGIISRSGDHLLHLINDLLEMSRIEAGQLVLTERSYNLHRLLVSLQSMFALKASQKGLTLEFAIAPDVPQFVCSDEAKLRQILINLLSNAIKFTPAGKVRLAVQATPVSTPPRPCACDPHESDCGQAIQLVMQVTDTGCGIAIADWETVFEAFMQTDQGRDAQGTGLGLAISRQFARLMHGDITLQSVLNQGTTFTCTVILYQPSLAASDVLEPVANTLQVLALAPDQPPYRILVVEDILENRQLLVTLLTSVGFEVDAVGDGLAAIAHWQTWQPHLIFMDIQIPEIDGHETTRRIRALAATTDTPPPKIIALTANAFENDRAAALAAGCDDFLTKPFNEATLFAAIARHLPVHYHYAELSSTVVPSGLRSVTPADLQIMPAGWRRQAYLAAIDLDEIKLLELIQQIPDPHHDLKQHLSHLVTSYQFEVVMNLAQLIPEP